MRLSQHSEFYIAGHCIALIGNEIRGPLCVLNKTITESERGIGLRVEAHQCNIGRTTSYWFSRRFPSQRAAAAAYAALEARYPNRLSCREVLTAQRGGRLQKVN